MSKKRSVCNCYIYLNKLSTTTVNKSTNTTSYYQSYIINTSITSINTLTNNQGYCKRFNSNSSNTNKAYFDRYIQQSHQKFNNTSTMSDTTTITDVSALDTSNKVASKSFKEELGDRMKLYEKSFNSSHLPLNTPFIIRLDGHGFSKFTKKFNKPWDIRVHNAMVEVANGLMKEFQPTMIYTFSDEISLCFPSISEEEFNEKMATISAGGSPIIYSGKVQKLVSLSAGKASTLFFKAMLEQTKGTPQNQYVIDSSPYFDSRIFVLPSNDEIINNIIWRGSVDCERNSIAGLAQANFSHKEIQGKSNSQVKKMLWELKGIDFEKEPNWYKYGVFIKKQHYSFDAVVPKTGESVTTLRSKMVTDSFDLRKCSKPLDYLTTKTLPIDFKLDLVSSSNTSSSSSSS